MLAEVNLFFRQNFVDLAGSERAAQALSAGARLKEGCHINRSLLTLSTVIRKLRFSNCLFLEHFSSLNSIVTEMLRRSRLSSLASEKTILYEENFSVFEENLVKSCPLISLGWTPVRIICCFPSLFFSRIIESFRKQIIYAMYSSSTFHYF